MNKDTKFHSLKIALLATTLSACAGSPLELSSREDLSSAKTVDLCDAAAFFSTQDPQKLRLLNEVHRREEISQKELEAAKNQKVFIGMSQTGALCSWGTPYDINQTTYSFGVHQQWVYTEGQYNIPSNFLYFENGVLTTIQN